MREDDDGDPEASLAASAVSGQAPPAGPQWVIRLRPPEPKALAYDKPLCASKDGFTLHAATRAGAAELLARTFAIDALTCPVCRGRMRLIAVLKNPASIARYLAGIGEPTELPARSPDRGPPHWKSTILRRQALGYEDA